MDRVPDSTGRFGPFGGSFVPETLSAALEELRTGFDSAWADDAFHAEFDRLLAEFVGRPSLLTFAERLTREWGGARIYLKREDLNHTGAHKINNTVGQLLLADRMGKSRIIAETGAGQHGVATATAAALFGKECHVYMGTEDIRRQELNVYRMKMLGSEVIPVESGSCTLKDAMNEAIRDWVTNVRNTHYVIGSVAGPHPYPLMVREFQKIIGIEARAQFLEARGRLPDAVVACVGGGSNAIGIFTAFMADEDVRLVGVEASGSGIASGHHAASIGAGRPGVLHGSYSYLLDTDSGQIREAHSIAAGLDYPGVGPEHSWLHDTGRAEYVSVDDAEATDAFLEFSRTEGILPALESSHALAYAKRLAIELGPEKSLLICLSGRGDKDVHTMAAWLESHGGDR